MRLSGQLHNLATAILEKMFLVPIGVQSWSGNGKDKNHAPGRNLSPLIQLAVSHLLIT